MKCTVVIDNYTSTLKIEVPVRSSAKDVAEIIIKEFPNTIARTGAHRVSVTAWRKGKGMVIAHDLTIKDGVMTYSFSNPAC